MKTRKIKTITVEVQYPTLTFTYNCFSKKEAKELALIDAWHTTPKPKIKYKSIK